MKMSFNFRNCFLLMSLTFVFAHSSFALKSGSYALVYSGDGACSEGCATAAGDMATRVGLTPIFVNQTALNSQSTESDRKALFQNVAVWIQPGGYSSNAVTSMTPELKESLRHWVYQGGGYVGFCAGAFASTKYSGDVDYRGIGVMPGETSLYWNNGMSLEIMPIIWGKKLRQLYFEGGPYIDHIEGKAEVIATYPNGTAAAARAVVGKGRVFIAGPHPEAPQWWRDFNNLQDSDGLDFDLTDEMILWSTKTDPSEVTLPPIPSPTPARLPAS